MRAQRRTLRLDRIRPDQPKSSSLGAARLHVNDHDLSAKRFVRLFGDDQVLLREKSLCKTQAEGVHEPIIPQLPVAAKAGFHRQNPESSGSNQIEHILPAKEAQMS